MNKYEVTVVATVNFSLTTFLQATSEEDAKSRALELARSGDLDFLSLGSENFVNYEATKVEEQS